MQQAGQAGLGSEAAARPPGAGPLTCVGGGVGGGGGGAQVGGGGGALGRRAVHAARAGRGQRHAGGRVRGAAAARRQGHLRAAAQHEAGRGGGLGVGGHARAAAAHMLARAQQARLCQQRVDGGLVGAAQALGRVAVLLRAALLAHAAHLLRAVLVLLQVHGGRLGLLLLAGQLPQQLAQQSVCGEQPRSKTLVSLGRGRAEQQTGTRHRNGAGARRPGGGAWGGDTQAGEAPAPRGALTLGAGAVLAHAHAAHALLLLAQQRGQRLGRQAAGQATGGGAAQGRHGGREGATGAAGRAAAQHAGSGQRVVGIVHLRQRRRQEGGGG